MPVAALIYSGVSLFVALFVLAPMAEALFRRAGIPRRLMLPAIALGTFTMMALPGTPAIQNAIPMPFFGITPFAAPGLGLIASAIMLGFGLWWLGRAGTRARGEGFSEIRATGVDRDTLRERAVMAQDFDPTEVTRGHQSADLPAPLVAAAPLLVVLAVNLIMSFIVLPGLDFSRLARPEWGSTSLGAVSGVWLVVAALPAFGLVREWALSIGGGPLVSMAVVTNILAALTGSASGGLTIALDALGETYLLRGAAELGIDPQLLHRVAVMSVGTLDSLPHSGAVVTLLSVCGVSANDSYPDIVMVAIVGALLALIAVILLGGVTRSF